MGNEDRFLYCFNRSDGSLHWSVRLTNRINASSIIVGDNVVTTTMDGRIFAHKLKTGEEVWRFELGSRMEGSPAYYDGKIVTGAGDGRIYILGE